MVSSWEIFLRASYDVFKQSFSCLFLGAAGIKIYLNGVTAMHLAAEAPDGDLITFLVGCGADSNAKAASDARPLYYAARHGYLKIVDIFLKLGAEINATNCEGTTPLHVAAKNGRTDAIALLASRGAL